MTKLKMIIFLTIITISMNRKSSYFIKLDYIFEQYLGVSTQSLVFHLNHIVDKAKKYFKNEEIRVWHMTNCGWTAEFCCKIWAQPKEERSLHPIPWDRVMEFTYYRKENTAAIIWNTYSSPPLFQLTHLRTLTWMHRCWKGKYLTIL